MENSRLSSVRIPKKGMKYICVNYYGDGSVFDDGRFVKGRVYRINSVRKNFDIDIDELRGYVYVYIENEVGTVSGFPLRCNDMVNLKNGIKIAYFDLHFRSISELRADKLRRLSVVFELCSVNR